MIKRTIKLRHTELNDVTFECQVSGDLTWENDKWLQEALARFDMALVLPFGSVSSATWEPADVIRSQRRIERINTGCFYSRGQRISILIEPTYGAYFVDHSRMIDGVVVGKDLKIADVILAYVKGRYEYWACHLALVDHEGRMLIEKERDLHDSAFADWSAEYRTQILGR